MAGIHTVFEAILDNGITGKKLVIPFDSRNDYETARTRLVALWTKHKETIIGIGAGDADPLMPYSLCADYKTAVDKETPATGVFYLGKPRRKVAKSYTFEIVDDSGASVSAELPKVANDDS